MEDRGRRTRKTRREQRVEAGGIRGWGKETVGSRRVELDDQLKDQ